MDAAKGFIIIYSGPESRLLEPVREFATYIEAYDALPAHKARYADQPRVRVLALGAESIGALKVTHGNFFASETFEELRGKVDAVLDRRR